MRLLVTGAAGFIGSTYVRNVLAGAYGDAGDVRITVLDKLTYAGNTANLADVQDHPGPTFVQGDICDTALLADLVPGHDAVVNFAAESHVDRSIAGADDFVRTNVLGTQALLEAARAARVPRFVHISTDEVYGSIETGSWTEDCALLANSPYAASKAGADILARAYARTYGMDVSVTRCSNNYGPYQYPEKLIPLFVTNLLEGGQLPLYGDGLCVRDWLHVDDHCRGVQLVLEKGRPGEAYNIGGGEELTNVELTHLLLEACGAGPERITYVPDRPGHDRRYSVDDSKLRELGYAPRVSFPDGLARTVDWYRDNPQWWKPLRRALSAAA
ncbi:dTDP-glucose 4,6-dehydratase [Streptomyces cellostaticus]|uniref:dTDP-glucose 4,6-dehydratase n=1 Tax=Streptomyces cellostaticus TaxID=67285 RepID=A0A101NI11_9ACTN|nr:dTDP-glucose 4,6-dehydratase [Streptomyces cellostaticus]KUM93535.1 dTDP-glucose 4,6-dehydratase [Streptomyces cellostaticus]GHI04289.1 dTDP-glucose 4,6-dehydratase [Streptomyces cellostaticus]